MEEGTILKWLVADGATVKRGDELAEIETDKATMTYEADTDGVVAIVAKEGETLAIGALIATIGDGSATPAPPPEPPAVAENGKPPETDELAAVDPDAQPAAPAAAATPDPPAGATAPPAPTRPASVPDGDRLKASPVARRIAAERGVDLASVSGTGPGGRIVRADVESATPGATAKPSSAPASAAPPAPSAPPAPADIGTAKGTPEIVELSRTQQLVARRMAESRATVPDFTLTSEIDMELCVELRARLKSLARDDAPVPSYNDMVVKACALALRDYPRANGAYRDAKFELYPHVNVGVAVAAQDSLVVPTVFGADQKSLGQIAQDTRALAARVRSGEITPPELSGGTFTVSNLGMYGVTRFTAVINPPQAAILAVGAMAERAVVRDGAVVARHMMDVTLACDHRILYGADAAEFLARIRELLEEPLALAL
jgi:pyruvate dehydrogenase E2 component (dihydrolipoamide acetyltransferase)